MKRIFKRTIATILVVLMLLTSAPVQGFVELEWPEIDFSGVGDWFGNKASAANDLAETGQCGDNVYWSYNSSTDKLVISGSGAMWNYNNVYAINDNYSPFYQNTNIESLVVEEGVTSIGRDSFSSCTALSTISLPDSLISICNESFEFCQSLADIYIPKNVTFIGNCAFNGCHKLETVDIPDSVIEMDGSAFVNCDNLKNVTIGVGLSKLSLPAFNSCDKLISISVDANNPYFCNDEKGVIFNKDKTLLIKYPEGSTSDSYVVPQGTTSIGNSAFNYSTNLKYVSLPDSLLLIDSSAFSNCSNLSETVIPDNVTTIKKNAFYNCGKMNRLVIGSSVETIEESSFQNCIEISGKLEIPDSITEIGVAAFRGCRKINELIIGDGLNRINDYTFEGCSAISSLSIGNSVKNIGKYAFTNCHSVGTLTIPSNVTSVDYMSFASCGLNSVTLSEGLVEIGESAFAVNQQLKIIHIPASVKNIGLRVFDACLNLEEITVADNSLYYSNDENGVLFDKDKTTLVQYPIGNKKTYYSVPDTVNAIGYCAFNNATNLTDIVMADSVVSLGQGVFQSCVNLTNISLSKKLKVIPNFAFYFCVNLKRIVLPDGITEIGESAFASCSLLESIVIPKSLTSIKRMGCNFSSQEKASNVHIYYEGTEEEWKKISINHNDSFSSHQNICPLVKGQIHYNSGSVLSKLVTNTKNTSNQKITITPKDASGNFNKDSSVSSFMRDVFEKLKNVTVESAEGVLKIADSYTELKSKIETGDVIFSCDKFYDYIIPKEVITSWSTSNGATYKFDAFMKKDNNNGKPYVSTVFGRVSGGNNPYVEITTSQLGINDKEKCDIIISAGSVGKNTEYYLSQDRKNKLKDPDSDGVFSAVDINKVFDETKTIYAYVINNGVSSDPIALNLDLIGSLPEHLENFYKNSTYSFFGKNAQGITIPKSVPLIGGGTISIDAFTIPFGIDVTGSRVRISLGKNIYKQSTEGLIGGKQERIGEFNFFKKEVKGISKNLKDSQKAWKAYKDLLDNKVVKQRKRSKKGFDLGVLGYVELDISNGTSIVDAYVTINGEFSYEYTRQLATALGPVYLAFAAKADIGLETQEVRIIDDPDVPFQFNRTLYIHPSVKISAGPGVKNAVSVGIYGKGSLPFENNFETEYRRISLNGEIGIEGQFFLIKASLPIVDGKFVIYDGYYGKSRKLLRSFEEDYQALNENSTEVSVASRDYAEDTSEWLGEYPVSLYSLADNGVTFNVLQTSIFNQSNPQLVSFGDNVMMTWIQDDTSRDAYNRMRLVYSLYDAENDIWSEPKAVYDDGHNDAYPSLATDGENVYVVWQKIDKTVTADDTTNVDVFLENSEIFVAKYDAKNDRFTDAAKLTDNEAYDYMPTVVVNNGNAVVYYATNKDNDLMATDNNTLYRHEPGKSAETLADNQSYIISAVPEIVNGAEKLSYSVDTDGDMSTSDDIAVYTISNGKTTSFDKDENEVAYTFAEYSMLDGTETLFVSDMNNIYYEQGGETKTVFNDSRLIEGNISFVEQESGLSVLWTENNEVGGNEFWTVSYEDGEWTEPVQISNIGSFRVSAVDVAMLGGKLVGVCNMNEMTLDEESGTYTEGEANLCSFTANNFTDISLDIYLVDEAEIIPGETSTIDVYVNNVGTTDVRAIEFTVSDTLGTDTTVTKEVNIKSGSTKLVEVGYPVPENYAATTLTISASIPDVEESDTADNTENIEIGKSDLSVMETELVNFGDNYILKAVVENNSAVDAEGVVVSAIFNDAEEEPFEKSEIGTLAKEQYVDYELAFNKELVEFDENGVGKLYVKVTSTSDESADVDNMICVVVILPEETECAHPLTEAVDAKKATCTDSGYDAYEICVVCEEVIGYEEIPAKGHTFTEEIIDEAHLASVATTSSPAIYKYDCANCDAISEDLTFTYGEKLSSLGKTEKITSIQNTSVVKLTWTAVEGANVYRVYRKTSSGWKKLADVTTLNYTIKSLKTGAKYSFAVKAGKKVDGKITWANSYTTINTATKAVNPSTVKAAQNTSAIKLTWNKVTGATGYRIYYKSDNTWKVTISSTTATSHTFKNLKAGAKFTFAVRPYIKTDSGVVWSAYTEFTTATKPANVTTKVTAPSKGKITLTWSQVNGADGYQIYYKIGNGGFKFYKTVGANVKSLNFSNLKSGTKYTFAVRAGIKTSGGNIFGGYKTATVTVK